jgi:hypothetical protein
MPARRSTGMGKLTAIAAPTAWVVAAFAVLGFLYLVLGA